MTKMKRISATQRKKAFINIYDVRFEWVNNLRWTSVDVKPFLAKANSERTKNTNIRESKIHNNNVVRQNMFVESQAHCIATRTKEKTESFWFVLSEFICINSDMHKRMHGISWANARITTPCYRCCAQCVNTHSESADIAGRDTICAKKNRYSRPE